MSMSWMRQFLGQKVSGSVQETAQIEMISSTSGDADDEWAGYNPDTDDYDVRTAPILPPPEDDPFESKQLAQLKSRTRKGGDVDVIGHYLKIIQEMEASIAKKDGLGGKASLAVPVWRPTHKRTHSAQSNASTSVPDDNDELLELPEEASHPESDSFVLPTLRQSATVIRGQPVEKTSTLLPTYLSRSTAAPTVYAQPRMRPVTIVYVSAPTVSPRKAVSMSPVCPPACVRQGTVAAAAAKPTLKQYRTGLSNSVPSWWAMQAEIGKSTEEPRYQGVKFL